MKIHALLFPLLLIVAILAGSHELAAQELEPSGVKGIELVYASAPSGVSRLLAVAPAISSLPIAIGPSVAAVPSRWAHRRRVMGALETRIQYVAPFVFLTPMGETTGDGAIHMVDARDGVTVRSTLVATGNPAAYDLAVDRSLRYVFSVEDSGLGTTTLRGFDYTTAGTLLPLSPPTLTLPGPPSSYVNRVGCDDPNDLLHVPTSDGIQVVRLSATTPHMSVAHSFQQPGFHPSTNPSSFTRDGKDCWIIGACRFESGTDPVEAAWLCWDADGGFETGVYGAVYSDPSKSWVPAAGTEELAVVGDGTDTYVYYLLREPPPGTFFIKPSAIGVTHFHGKEAATTATIPCPESCGEPFANPAVHDARVAFESSLGPPFTDNPPGGAEKINILYSPLDPLGAATPHGLLAVPGPLGGRISTKGMDRPIWTHDGTRVYAFTSHFPGAPNPAMPGIEALDVPAGVPVGSGSIPLLVVQNPTPDNRSIIFPSLFSPRNPAAAAGLGEFSFIGNVFHDGMASALDLPVTPLGQKQAGLFTQSPAVPNFPAILPPTFDDPHGSLVPIPVSFGARRTSFNLLPGIGLGGLFMSAASGDSFWIQPTGNNFMATVGIGTSLDPIPLPLPSGWVTTSEILSL